MMKKPILFVSTLAVLIMACNDAGEPTNEKSEDSTSNFPQDSSAMKNKTQAAPAESPSIALQEINDSLTKAQDFIGSTLSKLTRHF